MIRSKKIPVGKPTAHRAWLNPHNVSDPAKCWPRATASQLKAAENRLVLALSFFMLKYVGVSRSLISKTKDD